METLCSSRHIAWVALDAFRRTDVIIILWNDSSMKVIEVIEGTHNLILDLVLSGSYMF